MALTLTTVPEDYDLMENGVITMWSIDEETRATFTLTEERNATIQGLVAGAVVVTAELVRIVDDFPMGLNPPVKDTFTVTITSGT